MILNRDKLGRAVTFKKYLADVVSLVSGIKCAEFFRASEKWTYEECLQKKVTNIPSSIYFIAAYYKDFKSL